MVEGYTLARVAEDQRNLFKIDTNQIMPEERGYEGYKGVQRVKGIMRGLRGS